MIDIKEIETKEKMESGSALENIEDNEINVMWDLITLPPCCEDFPLKLVKYLRSYGKLNKLQAIILETEYQMEIRKAGFTFVTDRADRVALIKVIENPPAFTSLISEDQELIDYGLTLWVEETILISNPLSVTTEKDYQIQPYFYICDCEKSKVDRTEWACKRDFLIRMLVKHPNIWGISWLVKKMYRFREFWIALLVKLRLKENELAFLN